MNALNYTSPIISSAIIPVAPNTQYFYQVSDTAGVCTGIVYSFWSAPGAHPEPPTRCTNPRRSATPPGVCTGIVNSFWSAPGARPPVRALYPNIKPASAPAALGQHRLQAQAGCACHMLCSLVCLVVRTGSERASYPCTPVMSSRCFHSRMPGP